MLANASEILEIMKKCFLGTDDKVWIMNKCYKNSSSLKA